MLEIACFIASSAISAARAGADRIELCANYSAGGVTPSLSTLHSITEQLPSTQHVLDRTAIHVMIRPRGGDFVYSAIELEDMKSAINMFKHAGGVDGFVFGVLDGANMVDQDRNRDLVDTAKPFPCTFHRAIDQVEDVDSAVETIIGLGFCSILTSGGAKSAREGANKVVALQKKYGDKIKLILGGGVRSSNAVDLKRETGVEWVHSAAITEEGEEADEDEIRRMVTLLQDT